jgi:acetyl esterase/lipase
VGGATDLIDQYPMPLDSRVKRFLDFLAAGNPRSTLDITVGERRAALADLMHFAGPGAAVGEVVDRHIPGPAGPLAVRLYTPPVAPSARTAELLPGLVYFHGGGLVAGTVQTHDGIARALAHAGGCCVVSVDYRLAPEHPFPAAIEDALAAVRYLAVCAQDFGMDPGRLGICGDSAGGTLAAATAQTLASAGESSLALQLLICPILDYSRPTRSRRELATGFLLDQATLEGDLQHYLPAGGGIDPEHPWVSPSRTAPLPRLPPTFIHTAEFDPLRDEARDYFDRLTESGSPVTYTCHPGMIHLFYGLGAVVPYARAALAQMGGEIRLALAPRS